jgi:hypothetical protein
MDELIAFFELADFRCQPRPEHVGRKHKMKSSDAATALAAKKTSGKRGRGKRSTHAKTRTSTQELTLAKPLGRSKKFSAKSSGLSVAEKASLLGVGAASGRSKRALKLFGSDSSTMTMPLPACLKNILGSPLLRSKLRSLLVENYVQLIRLFFYVFCGL